MPESHQITVGLASLLCNLGPSLILLSFSSVPSLQWSVNNFLQFWIKMMYFFLSLILNIFKWWFASNKHNGRLKRKIANELSNIFSDTILKTEFFFCLLPKYEHYRFLNLFNKSLGFWSCSYLLIFLWDFCLFFEEANYRSVTYIHTSYLLLKM